MRRLAPWLSWGGLSALVLLSSTTALARLGGGGGYHSFHSGGHFHSGGGDGSGGGGADADLVLLLIRLVIVYPKVGLPIALLVLVGVIGHQMRGGTLPSGGGWSASEADAPQAVEAIAGTPAPDPGGSLDATTRQRLREIRPFDPDFSSVLLEDFLYSLYAEVQRQRPIGLERLSGYLSPRARTDLGSIQPVPTTVSDVVVGQLRFAGITGLEPGAASVGLRVAYESNYTERRGETDYPLKAAEIWTFERSKKARSKPPRATQLDLCPCCGAPLEGLREGRCAYCHNEVATGAFDWVVTEVEIVERELASKADLLDEGSTWDRPTRVELGAQDRLAELEAREDGLTFQAILARTHRLFQELQRAWADVDWQRARPFVSARLFENEAAFLERYRREGMHNVLKNQQLLTCELSDVESDPHYDQVTVRIRARGLDFVLGERERLLSGDPNREKTWSEYWTLIRGRSLAACVAAQKNCPSCGAEIQINMSGQCPYCRAEVTAASFDWVLSAIRQDDSPDWLEP